MITITFGGERFELLAERALWWPETATLLIADPHFGKSASFRGQGLPVPRGITADDLARLDRLIARHGARRLLVLGDFYHARSGRAAEIETEIAAWRAGHAELVIDLVRGNHDEHAGDPPACWRIRSVDEPHGEGTLSFRHDPIVEAGRFTIGGHLHPGWHGRRPCFWLSASRLVLPAFGTFTGTHRITAERGDRIFVVDGDRVVEAALDAPRPRRPRKSRVPDEDARLLEAATRARAPRPRD